MAHFVANPVHPSRCADGHFCDSKHNLAVWPHYASLFSWSGYASLEFCAHIIDQERAVLLLNGMPKIAWPRYASLPNCGHVMLPFWHAWGEIPSVRSLVRLLEVRG